MITTTITQRRRFTALRAAWLFDGSSATMTGNPTVVLDGASILAINAGTSPLPDNTPRWWVYPARRLLPGLVDTNDAILAVFVSVPVSARKPAAYLRNSLIGVGVEYRID